MPDPTFEMMRCMDVLPLRLADTSMIPDRICCLQQCISALNAADACCACNDSVRLYYTPQFAP